MSDTITVSITREDIENMLSCTKPKDQQICVELTRDGVMEFSGDQHNESWRWNFDKLLKEFPKTIDLYYFYKGVKDLNDKMKT